MPAVDSHSPAGLENRAMTDDNFERDYLKGMITYCTRLLITGHQSVIKSAASDACRVWVLYLINLKFSASAFSST